MLSVLSITAPIFLLMGVGFFAVRSRILSQEATASIGRFVLYFALPALVFGTVSQMHFSEIIDPSFISIYALGSLGSLLTGTLIGIFALGNRLSAGALKGLGMSISNSLFIGYPVLLQVFGEPQTRALAMVVMVENVITLPLALLIIEYGSSNREGNLITVWRSVFSRVSRNPIIIAIVSGLLVSASGLALPAMVNKSLEMLGQTAAATALFVIGGSLVGNRIRGDLQEILPVVVGKLLIHPTLVLLLLWIMPPFDPKLELSVLLMAAMPMFSIYPLIGSNYGLGRQCSSILVATTVLSFFTLTSLLLVVT